MKRLVLFLFTLLSFSVAYSQPGSLSQSVYRSRVTDSTTVNGAHASGYGDFYWNNDPASGIDPHWMVWDGTQYQVWDPSATGTGSGGSSFNHLTPSVKTTNYTAAAADTITHLYFRHVSTPMTLTLPGSGTIPVGRYVVMTKDTTANVTVVGASGVDVIGTLSITGDKETAVFHHRETNKWVRVGGSGGSSVSNWGDIGGTLSDQTDLQSALDAKVNNTGNETIAGIKTFSSDPLVPDEAYDATAWNGSLEPPTKNAVRDKIETLGSGGLTVGSTTITSGTNTRVLYNNSGTLGEYPIGTGVSTWWATPSSANLASAVTDETGSGAAVFASSPTLTTPALGTPSALNVSSVSASASDAITGTDNTKPLTSLSLEGKRSVKLVSFTNNATGSSTIDCGSKQEVTVYYNTTVTGNITIALSNDSNLEILDVIIPMTGSNITITMPSTTRMSRYNEVSSGDGWYQSTKILQVSSVGTADLHELSFKRATTAPVFLLRYDGPARN